MSELSVVLVCVITAILASLLKQHYPAYAILLICAAGIAVLSTTIIELSGLTNEIISTLDGIELAVDYIIVLIKAVCICILSEIASNICKDSGNASIATYVDIATKIILFSLSVPILKNLIAIIQDLFNL